MVGHDAPNALNQFPTWFYELSATQRRIIKQLIVCLLDSSCQCRLHESVKCSRCTDVFYAYKYLRPIYDDALTDWKQTR